MLKLYVISEKKSVGVSLSEIEEELKDAIYYSSPGNTPTPEHQSNIETGHIPAGSISAVPKNYLSTFLMSNNENPKEFVTYNFWVKWDENLNGHADNKHWNIHVYKSYHPGICGTLKPKKLNLPKEVDHITNSDWVVLQLVDNGDELISKKFERGQKKLNHLSFNIYRP